MESHYGWGELSCPSSTVGMQTGNEGAFSKDPQGGMIDHALDHIR
jgi:hypothetical protein